MNQSINQMVWLLKMFTCRLSPTALPVWVITPFSVSGSPGVPSLPARDRSGRPEGEAHQPEDGQQMGGQVGVHRRDAERGAGLLHPRRPRQGPARPRVRLPGGGRETRSLLTLCPPGLRSAPISGWVFRMLPFRDHCKNWDALACFYIFQLRNTLVILVWSPAALPAAYYFSGYGTLPRLPLPRWRNRSQRQACAHSPSAI